MNLIMFLICFNYSNGSKTLEAVALLSALLLLVPATYRSQIINQIPANHQQQISPAGQVPIQPKVDTVTSSPNFELSNRLQFPQLSQNYLMSNYAKPFISAPIAETNGQLGNLAPPARDSALLNRPFVSSPTTDIAVSPPPSNYLPNDDPMTSLDYSSINDEILKKKTANFVYFNANFNSCRNCHKFFNIWKDLAVDIRWWRQVIRLFTINCSDEDNIDICRKAGATQFPQVRYYWVMSSSLDRDGQRLKIIGKSLHAMRHMVMDKVLSSYSEHNKLLAGNKPRNVPQVPATIGTSLMLGLNPSSSMAAQNPLIAGLGGSLMSSILSQSGAGGLSSLLSGLSSAPKADGIGNLVNSLGGIQGVAKLMDTFMRATSMSKQFSVKPLPPNWPELEPIDLQDSQRLLESLPVDASRNIGALLIMESQEFLYTGPEVMLDLSPYSNQTYIARVKDYQSHLSKNLTERDDIKTPALIYISETRQVKLISTASKYTNDEDLRRSFVRAFEKRQVKYPVKRVWSNNQLARSMSNSNSWSEENEEILSKLNNVYIDDLNNALRISLMEQVFIHSDLSDDQYNALVKYVYTLINYFPFNNDQTPMFFKRLHTWLQNQVSPMDISEYKKQFHDVDDVLPKREWVACKSLRNSKTIPSRVKRPGLFDNPAQLGKVVSNITRLFRGSQQDASKLKNLFNVFTSNLSQNSKLSPPKGNSSQTTTTKPPVKESTTKQDESPIERIIKSLTSGSLGSDSSILKLISTALTGDSESTSSSKSKFAREFSCGAWKLAHVMVVNEYIKDSPRKDVRHIVLHSLYQYMIHFYGCPTCGNRVSDVSSEFHVHLNDDNQDQSDSVMLLWKVHNMVNKRLESELRPGSPAKIQFPSESLCSKCRLPKGQGENLGSSPNWHEKQVLNFLVHHYRPQSLMMNLNSSESSSSTSSYTKSMYTIQWQSLVLLFWLTIFSGLNVSEKSFKCFVSHAVVRRKV